MCHFPFLSLEFYLGINHVAVYLGCLFLCCLVAKRIQLLYEIGG